MQHRPLLVQIGLAGIKTRRDAMIWLWLAIIAAIAMPALTIVVCVSIMGTKVVTGIAWGLILGGPLPFAAAWYRYCISWMDKNRGWEKI
jgi:hypothetical protein